MCERLLVEHGTDSSSAITRASGESERGSVALAMSQFARYKDGSLTGSVQYSQKSVRGMSAAEWLESFGGMEDMGDTAAVAMQVTSKLPASAGTERNCSLYSGEQTEAPTPAVQFPYFLRSGKRTNVRFGATHAKMILINRFSLRPFGVVPRRFSSRCAIWEALGYVAGK